ncbi:hypothetical protein M4D57_25035 [Brevibacillus borstelensis]|uniref:hypothetical protein n=1 Tax=Brevibacillus borstelensis TaxID=45462 RepID=UPI00203B4C4F|nr:hypothetical protein [Brevibacillus borstelensis]MCM3561796.1 hypothetical protein [Brevibacillus borstelensis]
MTVDNAAPVASNPTDAAGAGTFDIDSALYIGGTAVTADGTTDITGELAEPVTDAAGNVTSITFDGTTITVNHGAGNPGDTISLDLTQFTDAAGNPMTGTFDLTNTAGTWGAALN